MKKLLACSFLILIFSSCALRKGVDSVSSFRVERIIRILSADDMQGRKVFSPGIDKAAKFIEGEFKRIGLQPIAGEKTFRQSWELYVISPGLTEVTIDGNDIPAENAWVSTDRAGIKWNTDPAINVVKIKPGDTFFVTLSNGALNFPAVPAGSKPKLVLIDGSFKEQFARVRSRLAQRPRTVSQLSTAEPVVYVLTPAEGKSFRVNFTNKIESKPLFNVAGMIPGRSKAKELVVFSGHYDHLGIVAPVAGDSIANGADDDASGVTAMISLAEYYKKNVRPERTLVFVAFTGEEVGGYGSGYFSRKVNPDDVVAMFNIEMIGKDSKFGPNSAFITGYERSDFGEILQKNLAGTDFKFYPDPYPAQDLFYRSDNATLAALGVPAHTISTDKIDIDPYYHQVTDEFRTLDVRNIIATIKAIALSSRSIVAGTDTPRRIPKLEPRPSR